MALGRESRDREVLELVAIGRIGPVGIGEGKEERHCVGRAERRRMTATILDVALLTAARVEEGAKPIRRGGR